MELTKRLLGVIGITLLLVAFGIAEAYIWDLGVATAWASAIIGVLLIIALPAVVAATYLAASPKTGTLLGMLIIFGVIVLVPALGITLFLFSDWSWPGFLFGLLGATLVLSAGIVVYLYKFGLPKKTTSEDNTTETT